MLSSEKGLRRPHGVTEKTQGLNREKLKSK